MKNKILLSLAILFALMVTSGPAASNTIATPSKLENKPLDRQPKFCGPSGCERSFKAILKLAKNGSPRAKMIVGLMYLNGIGTEQDNQKTHRHLMAAARAGQEIAQFAVGVLYIGGKVFERDVEEGNYWLKKAALRGYKPAIKLILKNDPTGDEKSLRRLKETDLARMGKSDGHIVVTNEYLTLDDFANYLKRNTPYGRRFSSGSRIRGLHYCAELSSACKKYGTETDADFDKLFRMIWTPGTPWNQ